MKTSILLRKNMRWEEIIHFALFLFDMRAPKYRKLSNAFNGKAFVVLKEISLQPSNSSRRTAELCKILGGIEQPYLTMKGDGGQDYSNTNPRNVMSDKLIMIKMKL